MNTLHSALLLVFALLFTAYGCKQSEAQATAALRAGNTGSWTHMDSVSYALGVDYARSLMAQEIEFNPAPLKAGMQTTVEEADPAISQQAAQLLLFQLRQELQKKAQQGQQQMGNAKIGSPAPDFSLQTPEGKELKLSDLRGKVVLIDFWASWCKPCRMENPNVVRMYNTYREKGFEILGVSLDRTKDAWVKAIQDDNLTWKHVSDLKFWNSAAAQLYGVRAIPYTVLVDKEGVIIAVNLRGPSLEAKLAEILG